MTFLIKMTCGLQVFNEEWYTRQLIKTEQNHYKMTDKNGKVWGTKVVFMRKDVS